jgi:cytochrome c oxidase subunit III
MERCPDIDAAALPAGAYGSRSPAWWGVMGLIIIEAVFFALLIACYFFFRMRYVEWPPPDAGPPSMLLPIVGVAIMLVTCYPLWRIEREAPTQSKAWLTRMLLLSAVLMAVSTWIRYYEFGSLHTGPWVHSYGSITWALLFAHGIELLLSTGETLLLAYYCATEELDMKHRADLELNSIFYYFVVASWVVIAGVLLLGGRLL